MKTTKLLSGMWNLFWMLFSLLITFPIWVSIFAYDLGTPTDDKDRTTAFMNIIWKFGSIK